ncbi:MAG TPA: RNA methyltransferase [Candidatus Angelobacter sp.]|nr:RNA methyltransferase [Candidatus Angelobacter sp.]
MAIHNEAEIDARLRSVSSRQNALVKDLRKAFTHSEPTAGGAIAIEGVRIIEEAIRSGLKFQAVFFSEHGRPHASRLLPQIAGHVEALLLPDEVFSSAVDTETPQGVAALVKMKQVRMEDVLEAPDADLLLVGLAGVQDPGNVGTIVRSAEAFSAQAVLLGEKTANCFNPKAVRASAGSVFRESVIVVGLQKAVGLLKQKGVKIVASSSHRGRAQECDNVDLTGPIALLIGGEGAGLPAEIQAQADELVTIPHSTRVESLNAGIAASILLYEVARQRRNKQRSISTSL